MYTYSKYINIYILKIEKEKTFQMIFLLIGEFKKKVTMNYR